MSAESVAKALGGATKSSTGWWQAKCPAHEGSEYPLGLRDTDDGGIAWKCLGGCDKGSVRAALEAKGLLPERPKGECKPKPRRRRATPNGHDEPEPAQPAEAAADAKDDAEAKRAHLQAEFNKGVPIEGTPAEGYLRGRRRLCPPWPVSLRWAGSFQPYPGASCRSAILCAVTDDAGQLVALHTILIDAATQDKTRTDKPKISYGPVGEGQVRLGVATAPVLVIGEGVETCLSRAVVGPADIRACCGSLRGVIPGKDHRRVEILADVDQLKTARALAQRYARVGLDAFVIEPQPFLGPKADLNDVLKLRGADGVAALVAGAIQYLAHARQSRQLELGSDVEIAARVIEDMEVLFGPDIHDEGTFWRYTGLKWEKLSETALTCVIQQWDGAEYPGPVTPAQIRLTAGRIKSTIYNMVALRSHPDAFATRTRGFACESGFVRLLDSGKVIVEPHERGHHTRHVLRGKYPIEGIAFQLESSLLLRLLTGCFADDEDKKAKIHLIQEVAAAAAFGIATKLKKPKAVILVGERAENGKSQFLTMMEGLVPPDAVCSISPSKFGDERHLPVLAGKLLNIAGELSTAAIASDNFKTIITGDCISGREAYQRVCEFAPIAQHLFATNVLPPFKSRIDRGVLRRLLPLGFNRVIPMEERVVDLGQRIAEEERDLLLDFAVEGAERLQKQGEFTVPKSSEALLTSWVTSVDPIRGWAATCIVIDDKTPGITTALAYQEFRRWAENEGINPNYLPSQNGFVMRLRNVEWRIIHEHQATRGVLKNVRLREPGEAA